MQVGDLVKFEPRPVDQDWDARRLGTVIRTDYYSGSTGAEFIIHVLWQNGALDWISAERVEIVT